MKTPPRPFPRLFLLCVLLCATLDQLASAVTAGLSRIPHRITREQFADGDTIRIEEVLASSRDLHVGDTVIVRGTYRLESRSSASLGFFLTTQGARGPRRTSADQQQEIKGGATGQFELRQVVRAEGALHVSFYPANGGSSFGGVYFGPVQR